jgi:predicted  nucleic acid-binding Zn-ribbon protein
MNINDINIKINSIDEKIEDLNYDIMVLRNRIESLEASDDFENYDRIEKLKRCLERELSRHSYLVNKYIKLLADRNDINF